MARYDKPSSLDAALRALAGGDWQVLAGGTDLYPAWGDRPVTRDVLDIGGLAALSGISESADGWRIGARATWTDIIRADLPPASDALKAAAREVGSVQIQNTGTVAGNLCNASPAADGVPALMVLDAEVELASVAGSRRLALGAFILGNRRTARRPDELLVAVHIPRAATAGVSRFVKLGARRYLVISIGMVAVRLEINGEGRIAGAAVAVGACSAVAQRLPGLEAALVGVDASGLDDAVDPEHFAALSPIDDVRASGDYRRGAAREITLRALRQALSVTDARKAAAA